MYRHLYRNPTILSRILIKEFANYKSEEYGYRYAALSQLREGKLNTEELHQMEILEHWELSRISVLPQIFTIFNTLHKATRKESIITYPQIESINRMTALLDPNMFPIQDLKEKLHTNDAISIWRKENRTVKDNIGFNLIIQPSAIDHVEAGDGVFLSTNERGKSVPPGTLLGFVPGVLYDSYAEYRDQTPPDMHFFRFDGAIVDFSQKFYHPYIPGYSLADYQEKIMELRALAERSSLSQRNKLDAGFELVHGSMINPYAVGHMINHTPRNKSTNVCLIDIFVPVSFFPYELMKFWPSIHDSNEIQLFSLEGTNYWVQQQYPKKKYFRGLGIMAINDIKDGEELYLDYLESCLFDMEIEVPDWLIKPPPVHPQITKQQFKTKPSLLHSLLEDYAFKRTKDGQNYDRFMQQILREQQYL